MKRRTDDDPERIALLQYAYQFGYEAAALEDRNIATAFAQKYGSDTDLMGEFQRGAVDQARAERTHSGVLLEHGEAPYNWDPDNKLNYFVTLGTPHGKATIWGIDLKRAVSMSGLDVGDGVKLDFRGLVPVKVDEVQRDANGKVIGTKPVETHRNEWDVQRWDVAGLVSKIVNPGTAVDSGSTSAIEPNRSRASGSLAGPRFAPADSVRQQIYRPSFSDSVMLGARGMGGVRGLLSAGAAPLNSAITDYRLGRTERELSNLLSEVSQDLYKLRGAGLERLNEVGLDPEERSALIKSVFDAHDNAVTRQSLFSKMEKMNHLAQEVIKNPSAMERQEDELTALSIDPLKDIMKEHERVLKGVSSDGRTLYECMESMINHIAQLIHGLFSKIGSVVLGGTRSSHQHGPR